MDVLYVLGNGSKHNNEELRYSLRSLVRYCNRSLERVFLVGECPEWLDTTKVIYIPYKDTYAHKCHNILAKIEYAIEHSDLPDHFLWSADDIFHICVTDLNNYPYYHKNGAQVGLPDSYRGKPWWFVIQETQRLLKKYHYPLEDYGGGHCLHHVDVPLLRRMPKIKADIMASACGAPIDIIMGNAIVKQYHPETVVRYDVKLSSVKDEDDFIRQVGGAECFSINDRAWDEFVGAWLQGHFKSRCRFERVIQNSKI